MKDEIIIHKTFIDYSIKDFENLPIAKFQNNILEFDSIIILPTKDIHDSGFRCIEFVGVVGQSPVCKFSGHSDIIHLDGIGGRGYNWIDSFNKGSHIIPKGWSIDCLSKSGLLRIFSNYKLIACDPLSSFELYSEKK